MHLASTVTLSLEWQVVDKVT